MMISLRCTAHHSCVPKAFGSIEHGRIVPAGGFHQV